MELYHPDLPLKPEIVAANKVDMPGTRERAKGLSEALGKEDVAVWHISALTGEGVKELLYAVVDSLSKTAVDEVEALPPRITRAGKPNEGGRGSGMQRLNATATST